MNEETGELVYLPKQPKQQPLSEEQLQLRVAERLNRMQEEYGLTARLKNKIKQQEERENNQFWMKAGSHLLLISTLVSGLLYLILK